MDAGGVSGARHKLPGMADEFHAEGDGPEVLRWGAAGVGDEEAEAGAEAEDSADLGEVGLGERDAGAAGAVQGVAAAREGVSGGGDVGGEKVAVQSASPAHHLEPVSVREFHDNGLVWLANRALHPFGYALSVQATVDPDVPGSYEIVEEAGVRVVRTTDPLGLMFDEKTEDESREKFFAWLSARPRTSAPL